MEAKHKRYYEDVVKYRTERGIDIYTARDFLHRCMTLLYKQKKAEVERSPIFKSKSKNNKRLEVHRRMYEFLNSNVQDIRLDSFLGLAESTPADVAFVGVFFGRELASRNAKFNNVQGIEIVRANANEIWLAVHAIAVSKGPSMGGLFLRSLPLPRSKKEAKIPDLLNFHISIPETGLDYHFTNSSFNSPEKSDRSIKHFWFFNSGVKVRDDQLTQREDLLLERFVELPKYPREAAGRTLSYPDPGLEYRKDMLVGRGAALGGSGASPLGALSGAAGGGDGTGPAPPPGAPPRYGAGGAPGPARPAVSPLVAAEKAAEEARAATSIQRLTRGVLGRKKAATLKANREEARRKAFPKSKLRLEALAYEPSPAMAPGFSPMAAMPAALPAASPMAYGAPLLPGASPIAAMPAVLPAASPMAYGPPLLPGAFPMGAGPAMGSGVSPMAYGASLLPGAFPMGAGPAMGSGVSPMAYRASLLPGNSPIGYGQPIPPGMPQGQLQAMLQQQAALQAAVLQQRYAYLVKMGLLPHPGYPYPRPPQPPPGGGMGGMGGYPPPGGGFGGGRRKTRSKARRGPQKTRRSKQRR